jgi:hypothetical protein
MRKLVLVLCDRAPARATSFCELDGKAAYCHAICERTFARNEIWQNGLASTRKRGGRVHIVGRIPPVTEELERACVGAGVFVLTHPGSRILEPRSLWRDMRVADEDCVFCVERHHEFVELVAKRRRPTCYFATLEYMHPRVLYAYGPDLDGLREAARGAEFEIRVGGSTGTLFLSPDGLSARGLMLARKGTTDDLAPTVLRLLGLPQPRSMPGRPLLDPQPPVRHLRS